MKLFPFQGIMLHTADYIECTEEDLKLLLKAFQMFKISIIYNEIIDNKDVWITFGILSIKCEKKWVAS